MRKCIIMLMVLVCALLFSIISENKSAEINENVIAINDLDDEFFKIKE